MNDRHRIPDGVEPGTAEHHAAAIVRRLGDDLSRRRRPTRHDGTQVRRPGADQ
ncbi:hypothetical protein [Amycolatopsis sp. CA-128772]|uniref:hypothetical protein n=1 Tax=Amycolatopsis sp. CA-128772 TaxID=2073159 RepID=UPI0013047E82|nr:hypothetical protein [Amycolatopsis sp. CA-128772]